VNTVASKFSDDMIHVMENPMPVLSRLLSSAVEKLLFHPVTITGVETVGESYRLLTMQGVGFQGVKWIPGQTIQIFLGNLTKRAYTPMRLDADAGSASFLFYLHGKGPGSEWAASARAGNVCQVMRPKDSIDFTSFTQPALFFGDETSLAAAQALHACRGQSAVARYVFEVHSPVQAEVVLQRFGVTQASLVQKREDGSHLGDVISQMAAQALRMQSPQWVFTGQARSIQSVRRGLKQTGVPLAGSKVKAYWSPGKTGLD
jgi:ferric-chelate reductase (NADPH)